MRAKIAFSTFALCLACSMLRAGGETSEQKCPVVIEHVELSYNHQGGQSKPQLILKFDNNSGKRISAITFSLSVLDSGGYPRPYPDDLQYRDSLDAGRQKVFTWSLPFESVDMYRTGERIFVQDVEF